MSVVVACRSQMRWPARAFPREMQSVTVGSDPWAVCTRVQDWGEQGGDRAARGTTTVPVRKTMTFIMRYTRSRCGVSRRFGDSVGAVVTIKEIWKQENRSAVRTINHPSKSICGMQASRLGLRGITFKRGLRKQSWHQLGRAKIEDCGE
jgi:hypothetical protein